VKHCEVLKRHSFPATCNSSVVAWYLLLQEASQPTESSVREPPTFEQPTCVLNAFMETASEVMTLCSIPSHPQSWRAQSPPSDITQSPVPSLSSEPELPDFGDDFVKVDEEMTSHCFILCLLDNKREKIIVKCGCLEIFPRVVVAYLEAVSWES